MRARIREINVLDEIRRSFLDALDFGPADPQPVGEPGLRHIVGLVQDQRLGMAAAVVGLARMPEARLAGERGGW